ncbi:MAG: hypothetical protein HKM93_03710 [Desulfobacteraceae bacterium]|nr:hypothetical protein [Desulfobacteraceae bacterium]
MTDKQKLLKFNPDQIEMVNNSVAMAEELVSNHFKMSASQWLHPKYDVKTLADLAPDEIVNGPFAQVIRYKGRRIGKTLESASYDLYKICLQDHSIISILKSKKDLRLFPFALYIITHELIHIVRFSKFLQSFAASEDEKYLEEARVHNYTRLILNDIQICGLDKVLAFYSNWQIPIEGVRLS